MKLLFALGLLAFIVHKASCVEQIVYNYAKGGSIPPEVFVAMAKQESSLNPKAIGDKGKARGLFQIHEAAVIDSGFVLESLEELFEPKTNTLVAIYYLYGLYAQLDGSLLCAVSAFNKGIANVKKYKTPCVKHKYVGNISSKLLGLRRK